MYFYLLAILVLSISNSFSNPTERKIGTYCVVGYLFEAKKSGTTIGTFTDNTGKITKKSISDEMEIGTDIRCITLTENTPKGLRTSIFERESNYEWSYRVEKEKKSKKCTIKCTIL